MPPQNFNRLGRFPFPALARSVTDAGLIDEYRLYFHPVVLGRGKPFFGSPRPPLRLWQRSN
jgi:riboflavin biosynthesis pyrimidine reductase